MRRKIWLAMALLAFPQWVAAAEPEFQFSKAIKTPALKQEEMLSVPLDADVCAATREQFDDMRLFDGDGKPVPFLLRKAQTTKARKSRHSWTAKKVAAKPLENNGLEITLQLEEKDPVPAGFTIVSPLKNFEHRVRVETSLDGQKWEPAGTEAVIFDYSRFMDIRNDIVPIPESKHRHFRIVIDNVTAEQQSELLALTRRLQGGDEKERTEKVVIDRRPFRIDRIEFWRDVESDQTVGDELRSYPVSRFRIEPDAKNHQTVVYIATQRQPLTSLEIATPDRNFSRHASVEVERVQGVKKSWEKIGEATLSRVEFKNLKRESLGVTFPESRHAEYRIVIDDRENPPLAVSAIKAEGHAYNLVFLAAPSKQYQLRYGNAEVGPPAGDTAALHELLREKFKPTAAELEAQVARTAGPPPSDLDWKKALNNPLLLGGVASVLVAVLGLGLYRAMRRMDQLPNG